MICWSKYVLITSLLVHARYDLRVSVMIHTWHFPDPHMTLWLHWQSTHNMTSWVACWSKTLWPPCSSTHNLMALVLINRNLCLPFCSAHDLTISKLAHTWPYGFDYPSMRIWPSGFNTCPQMTLWVSRWYTLMWYFRFHAAPHMFVLNHTQYEFMASMEVPTR